MIRNPECHGWRFADGFMHAAKIVMRDGYRRPAQAAN
jgi:hypothetical protein